VTYKTIWECRCHDSFHVNEPHHIRMSHVTYEWVMSHMNEPRRIWMSHVIYEWAISHMNESCHIWMSHVTHKCSHRVPHKMIWESVCRDSFSYVHYDSFLCVPWLILACVLWLIFVCVMTSAPDLIHMCLDWYIQVTYKSRPRYGHLSKVERWLHLVHSSICSTWRVIHDSSGYSRVRIQHIHRRSKSDLK